MLVCLNYKFLILEALHPDTWVPCRLASRVQLNSSTHYFSFALPNKTDQMGLLAGQYIAVRALIDGKYMERFYSPVNRNSDFGKIDLIVKLEEVKMNVASMTRYFSCLQPGNTLEIRGPLGGFEYHRNMYKEVGMIAGGTGISPMMQVWIDIC
jgi:cytochrome-b5 reductase